MKRVGLSFSSTGWNALVLTGLLGLSACQSSGFSANGTQRPLVNPAPGSTNKVLSSTVNGEKVGNGPVRIALLLPLSATGNASIIGAELANAARLAVRDFGAGTLQVVIKDTKGQTAEAATLAAQARDEGASLVLGPLFSANVSAASAVTKPARIPMIAFSSDIARARPDTYLLSFAPDADIRRTLSYGISQGANRIVALLPDSSYGRLAEQELRRTYDNAGGQVVSVVRYARDANAMVTAARSVALPLTNADALYIPDGGQVPALMLNSLKKAGVSLAGKQVLGSGQWDNIDKTKPALDGAIYAGADRRSFPDFARRYEAVNGKAPSVTAALGYDAVSLAAELIRRNRQAPFDPAAIQSRGGFNGATGLFRFERNGRLQRGLVINKIEGGAAVVVSPAPRSFNGSR